VRRELQQEDRSFILSPAALAAVPQIASQRAGVRLHAIAGEILA
jgi:hypothetical protein